jgi:hypothetical protein
MRQRSSVDKNKKEPLAEFDDRDSIDDEIA